MPLDTLPPSSPAPASAGESEALYAVATHGQIQPALSLEWLLTNGSGGFASSTIAGANARRYHGLLCAALKPPLGRIIALSRVAEVLRLDGRLDQPHELGVNQFRQTFFPRGDRYLRRFDLGSDPAPAPGAGPARGDVARWEYFVEGVRVVKEVQVVWQRNVVGVRYTIDPDPPRQVEMQLLPFVALRDFHSLRSASGARFRVAGQGARASITDDSAGDGPTLYLQTDAGAAGGQFVERPDWWYGHTYAIETERGQDDTEDLFTPGPFVFHTTGKATVTLWAGTEPPGALDWDEELARRPRPPLPPSKGAGPSPAVQKLARAAADFIVGRRTPDGSAGRTVLAGYPWFADWGRDTMIALPGLFLTTGRFEEAARVLGGFAQYVSEGMIPNVFDDYSNVPHYNTVDASLWFIHACHEYRRLSGDSATFDAKLRPACEAILAGYEKGTRFHIAMDEADGLISAGDAQTQLTWMDAKCGGIAFTPRHGKAVEINALWYNALKLMGREALAGRVAASFVRTFWLNSFRGLYDVAHAAGGGNGAGAGAEGGEARRDAALRPNQIFAVSLPHSPLTRDQQHAVVDVVQRELLTPYGLRSLAKGEAGYRGTYRGDQMCRDAAYHNGTVWGWLIGPFLDAYLRVHDRKASAVAQARQWLQPLLDHLEHQGCVGQISEIFEGDAPHRPGGCPAQAWSVAEVLRLAVDLGV